jgi:transglutaminase-like putative cysteine protease
MNTLVKPDKPIREARTTRSATYVLSVADGPMPDVPETSAQSVERMDEKHVRVRINCGDSHAGALGIDDEAKYLAASSMLNRDDAQIRALAEKATASIGPAKGARAEAIRRFVNQYIDKKDLGVGFATASETARTRTGDCTEHAALLAAMLRADGIPSRVVSGLVYVSAFAGGKNVFGYHMWAQALLAEDGGPERAHWVDLDAALSPEVAFDATHIAMSTSAMADGESENTMVALVPVIGRLRIQVIEAGQSPAPTVHGAQGH